MTALQQNARKLVLPPDATFDYPQTRPGRAGAATESAGRNPSYLGSTGDDFIGELKIAIVHDWLYTVGGAERVLRAIVRCLPGATVYALFDALTEDERSRIGHTHTKTSFLQKMPGIRSRHRLYLPLMPLAVEQFDLSGYDLVISSSYAVAKGVLTGPDQLHLSYVHSPMRYAWDLQHQYLREAGLDRGVRGWLARVILHRMRMWDSRTAHGVDGWMANSHFVARRIGKIYGQKAVVIPPPVTIPSSAPPACAKADYFLTASRLVPYKNVRAIVQAFAALPNHKLIVAGEGPERGKLEGIAGRNVEFHGYVPDVQLRKLMREARAFIFAAEEDFGITPVEAQGEGTPVIALARGGARETIAASGAAPTGLFFNRPTPGEIVDAVHRYLQTEQRYLGVECWRNALRFSEERFTSAFINHIRLEWASFRERIGAGVDATPMRYRASDRDVLARKEVF